MLARAGIEDESPGQTGTRKKLITKLGFLSQVYNTSLSSVIKFEDNMELL